MLPSKQCAALEDEADEQFDVGIRPEIQMSRIESGCLDFFAFSSRFEAANSVTGLSKFMQFLLEGMIDSQWKILASELFFFAGFVPWAD